MMGLCLGDGIAAMPHKYRTICASKMLIYECVCPEYKLRDQLYGRVSVKQNERVPCLTICGGLVIVHLSAILSKFIHIVAAGATHTYNCLLSIVTSLVDYRFRRFDFMVEQRNYIDMSKYNIVIALVLI